MVRAVQLSSALTDSATLEVLKGSTVYCSDPGHYSVEGLRVLGIEVLPLPSAGVPDGSSLILLPPATELDRLVSIVDRLLGPGGCPWDQAQTHDTLKKYLLEEAYEVVDAIESNSPEALREELGDLLLQPVMHGQISSANGGFNTEDCARGIVEKLIRRHPHVFGDTAVENADEVLRNWDTIKKAEKSDEERSILAGIPAALPSLHRAYEVSKRAARAGFEWPDIAGVFAKLDEEFAELRTAVEAGDKAEIESETGDLLFTIVNIARWSKVEPEEALRKMVNRFVGRFQHMERNSTKELRELSLAEWDELWLAAKDSERLTVS